VIWKIWEELEEEAAAKTASPSSPGGSMAARGSQVVGGSVAVFKGNPGPPRPRGSQPYLLESFEISTDHCWMPVPFGELMALEKQDAQHDSDPPVI
jgi:hypothetical protein